MRVAHLVAQHWAQIKPSPLDEVEDHLQKAHREHVCTAYKMHYTVLI